MPQPKQPASSKPPVRGDATKAPAPAKAPAGSTKAAVAKKAAPEKAAAKKAKPAAKKPKPAATSNATPSVAARPKAAPGGRTAKPKPKPKPAAARRPKASPAAARPAADPAPAPDPSSAAARDEALRANLASLRDLLAGGVVLTTQRLQEAVDEAVARGRMTRRDAEDLASGLLTAGRQQTQDLLAELEQLLGRGRSDLGSARSITKGAVKGSSERVLREVDRARRAAGLGSSFPILGYDELTAAQVTARLGELTPAELRKVRTYEKKTANRATVLKAVEQALA